MRFALIGGSGGLGSILTDHLTLRGHEARRWSRSAEYSLDVLDPDPPRAAFDTDGVIYLAWATTDRSPEVQNRHAQAAIRWSERAAEARVPFIFVSTVLAASTSGSEYGRAKLVAERGVRERHGRNVRVGLVVDDGYHELLASRLRRLANRAPWLSRLGDWPVLPVSGETAASIILADSLSDVDATSPLFAAERAHVRLATIMSGAPDPQVLPWVSRGTTALARHYPTSRGAIGRHVDALRGLTLTQFELEGTRDPSEGPIAIGDWRRGISPTERG